MARRLAAVVAALILVNAVVLGATSAPAADGDDLLPDLGMARLQDFKTEKRSGRVFLRYSSIIVNAGSGPFEAHGRRLSTAEPEMSVAQRVFTEGGGYRDIATPARMFFAGDGHTHWHVRDLETSELIRLDNGSKVGTGAKRGFCFFDNVRHNLSRPGAPQSEVYTACGRSSDLEVTMGLSIGWGDAYYWNLPDQYIDITGLNAGRYRLQVTADEQNNFLESDGSNNTTWVDLQLKGSGSPRVVGYGPSL